ncbi:HAD family hydrolase [Neomegalonema perideroedes]|uniref:HAD family hydrolase n=1 Tax=Neomegalonema perideroedes TaxID=217219 RepID=UPI00037965DC|nr:HAD family phosphatase [Neomegalonema perideroedes]
MARIVVFDVGNVLISWDPHAPYRAHFPDEAAIAAFLEEIGFYAWNLENDRGRPWDQAVAELSAEFPHRAELIALAHREWASTVTGPIAGTVEILRRLKAAGVPVYAITNFSPEKWRESVARFDFLREGFLDVVVSGDEKLVKPDLRIYETLLKRNGLKAEDCVFIDDSLPNVEGARAAGMKAIHFQNPEALARELQALGFAAAAA